MRCRHNIGNFAMQKIPSQIFATRRKDHQLYGLALVVGEYFPSGCRCAEYPCTKGLGCLLTPSPSNVRAG